MSKAPRFTLDQLRPSLQGQVVDVLHGSRPSSRPPAPSKAPKATQTPAKPSKRRLVARTRNHGTLTEAAYWGHLRSALRRAFRFWKPALAALKAARVPYGRGRVKWAYLCADCRKLFRREGVQIDHIIPAGQLTSLEHVSDFIRRLTPEDPAAFKIRCRKCHQVKTTAERVSPPGRPSVS